YGGLVLTSTGLVYGWGLNNFGEVGDGTTTVRSAPVLVSLPAGVTVTKIAGEFSSGLALASNGQVLAWGDNADGGVAARRRRHHRDRRRGLRRTGPDLGRQGAGLGARHRRRAGKQQPQQ